MVSTLPDVWIWIGVVKNSIGVVGGVIVLVILMVGIMIARRRYVASRRPPSTLHGPQGTSPYRVPHSPTSPGDGTEHSMGQKLYVGLNCTTFVVELAQSPPGPIRSNHLSLSIELRAFDHDVSQCVG